MATAPRAIWKGFLKLGVVSCGVKLVGATSEAGKIHFRILNRKDRLPVKSAYIDEGTGKLVETEDQVKGYETDKGEFLLIEPDEIKALKLQTEHTVDIDGFVEKASVDPVYFEKPYSMIPAAAASAEAFAVIREALARKKMAAMACIVLYQRTHYALIEPKDKGMLMTTLRNYNEVVAASSAFEGLKKIKVDKDMAEIASMIIDKKRTSFDPSSFEDTYENALIVMIEAKRKGKKLPKAAPRPKENVVNLMEVLKKSLAQEGGAPQKKTVGRKKSAA
ncbi:MAG: Ku protein [Rhizobiaceae bacterium]